MARPREFNLNMALEKAMELFWLQGYEATSTQELLQHMGIGRQSLYNTFGDKHQLFLAALDRYCEMRIGGLLSKLELPDASLDAIHRYFELILECPGSESPPRSCFMLNSTVELAGHDNEVAKRCKLTLERVEAAFFNAITNAINKGELANCDNPRAIARHLTNTILGLGINVKGGASREVLQDIITAALSVLR